MAETVRSRVRRGAQLLDEKLTDWRKIIDPETLELQDPCQCVLGQLFGGYGRGRTLLGIRRGSRYAFNTMEGEHWAALDKAWKKEIER